MKKNEVDVSKIIDNIDSKLVDSIFEYNTLDKKYNSLINSKTWKLLKPLRKTLDFFKQGKICEEKDIDLYNSWIQKEENIIKKYNDNNNILFSIIIPINNNNPVLIKRSVDSIIKQSYLNYEIILVSCIHDISFILSNYKYNKKVRIINKKNYNNIVDCINEGIKQSNGNYVGIVNAGDFLSRNALLEIAHYINKNPNTNYLYTDEDLYSSEKNFEKPFFKPDWSPDLLLWNNYCNNFSVFKKSIIKKADYIENGYINYYMYDFLLRITEKINPDTIKHIDKVLYHQDKNNTDLLRNNNININELNEIKKATLSRRKIIGKINIDGENVIYDCNNKSVSIIIPSKNNYAMLKKCIESIISISEYNRYEIIVVDNGSDDKNKKKINEFLKKIKVKYIYKKEDFNFAKMCNMGAKRAKNDVLLFLNDDIEIIDKNWLSILVGQAIQPSTGAVGAKLYYPNSFIIQHCGVANKLNRPIHSLRGYEDNHIYYYYRNKANYNVLAVTAACMAIEKKKFNKIGGFCETLPNDYNDIDFCMRLDNNGFYNIIRNDVHLYHHESISRNNHDVNMSYARELLFKRNSNYIFYDPYFNINMVKFNKYFDY